MPHIAISTIPQSRIEQDNAAAQRAATHQVNRAIVIAFCVLAMALILGGGLYFTTQIEQTGKSLFRKNYQAQEKLPDSGWIYNQFGMHARKGELPPIGTASSVASQAALATVSSASAASSTVMAQNDVAPLPAASATPGAWNKTRVLEKGALNPINNVAVAASNAPDIARLNIRTANAVGSGGAKSSTLSASVLLLGVRPPIQGECRRGDQCTLWVSFDGQEAVAYTAQVSSQSDSDANKQARISTQLYFDDPEQFAQQAKTAHSIRITTQEWAQNEVVLAFEPQSAPEAPISEQADH